MSRLQGLLLVLCMGALGFACGGTSSGLIPAHSPLVRFQPPETEDLLPDTASANEDDGDDADDLNDEDLLGEDPADAKTGDKAGDEGSPAPK